MRNLAEIKSIIELHEGCVGNTVENYLRLALQLLGITKSVKRLFSE